jgi:hypothetical protein
LHSSWGWKDISLLLCEAGILNGHFYKHWNICLGHNVTTYSVSSIKTVIKTKLGIVQVTEFFHNSSACFDHNSHGDEALLCNRTTVFSVTEKIFLKVSLLVQTDILLFQKGFCYVWNALLCCDGYVYWTGTLT